ADGRLSVFNVLRDWVAKQPEEIALSNVCDVLARTSPVHRQLTLPGPTGERNTYTLLPREGILSLSHDRGDLLFQLAIVLAVDSRALWFDSAFTRTLHAELPADVQARIRLVEDERAGVFDAALIQADEAAVRAWTHRLAQRTGPIVSLQAADKGVREAGAFSLELLVIERSVSINTAAAGGNASLMTIG
ncbi:MAG: trifunctional transcriptional regulator/proline dehydrogenase/L-glutamate gamma-semialdehyde dehydrogenase, partial [Burkholderiaceae bacterium]